LNLIRRAFDSFSGSARSARAEIFRGSFALGPTTRILDLGSEDGSHIAAVIAGTDVRPENVFIADIDTDLLKAGSDKYGFTPVELSENGRVPFGDGEFDIVFCSSVIEHVTIPKEEVWEVRSGREFRNRSWERQREFASEIARVGKRYFVQTPARSFPLESHTWLPMLGLLPRELMVPVMGLTNRFWVKQADPDFNLLNEANMAKLFPEARIEKEVRFGMTKSLMAIKASK
jgi:SAM-dependent methyltransferase